MADPNNIRRGNIYWTEFQRQSGCEMDKGRPAVIVSCDALNGTSSLVTVVPVSGTATRRELPEHVAVAGLEKPSWALCEHIYTKDKALLGRYMGRVSDRELTQIDDALCAGLGLGAWAADKPPDGLDPSAPAGPLDDSGFADAEEDDEAAALYDETVALRAQLTLLRELYDALLAR